MNWKKSLTLKVKLKGKEEKLKIAHEFQNWIIILIIFTMWDKRE